MGRIMKQSGISLYTIDDTYFVYRKYNTLCIVASSVRQISNGNSEGYLP